MLLFKSPSTGAESVPIADFSDLWSVHFNLWHTLLSSRILLICFYSFTYTVKIFVFWPNRPRPHCFNCGSEEHQMKDCSMVKFPFNEKNIFEPALSSVFNLFMALCDKRELPLLISWGLWTWKIYFNSKALDCFKTWLQCSVLKWMEDHELIFRQYIFKTWFYVLVILR